MRSFRSRVDDSTFELNLAPMLDIIVSIIPMLLLSVVFVRVTSIDAPLPQPVAEAIQQDRNDKTITINLQISKKQGFVFVVNENGKKSELSVPLKEAKLDLEGLHARARDLKRQYPQTFQVELYPEQDVPLNEIVKAIDEIRRFKKEEGMVAFNDVKTGKPVETDLMFPDVSFANVIGD